MQIHLTYRNSLRNVKRRVLHTRASVMYYITRASFGCFASLISMDASLPSFWAEALRLSSVNAALGCQADSLIRWKASL